MRRSCCDPAGTDYYRAPKLKTFVVLLHPVQDATGRYVGEFRSLHIEAHMGYVEMPFDPVRYDDPRSPDYEQKQAAAVDALMDQVGAFETADKRYDDA